ncbi:hypothetical protein D0865_06684 [Hortaea werneckii]|uniref:Uncharacterized protein n=1 Tax=Hortaea werneckii TaxID=91943 RepID=A0A3M7CFC6_HORWE|nr:hypothetical protein D0865_06684 [Hortaea werneckii]
MTKNQHHPKIQSKWLTYSLLSIAPGDHPAAGQFTSLGGESQEGVKKANRQLSKPRTEAWKKGALGTVNRILRDPLSLQVINVVGGGRDQDWALVELKADAVCKNGLRGWVGVTDEELQMVGMPYPQRYAWVMRFDENGTIVQVRAYLDSALVQKAVDSNS